MKAFSSFIKYIAALCIVVFFGMACKQVSATPPASPYSISCDVNGVAATYASNLVSNIGPPLDIQASADNSNLSILAINILSNSPINTTTTYTNDSAENNSGLIFLSVNGISYGLKAYDSTFKINFTQITPTTVTGTFSGNVFDKNGDEESITNGNFYVPAP